MIIRLRHKGGVALVDADNLRELKVVVDRELSRQAAAEQLVGLGRLDESHAWLDVDALAEAARPHASTSAWELEYLAMISYAASKGWANDDSTQVRAHVEPAIIDELAPSSEVSDPPEASHR